MAVRRERTTSLCDDEAALGDVADAELAAFVVVEEAGREGVGGSVMPAS